MFYIVALSIISRSIASQNVQDRSFMPNAFGHSLTISLQKMSDSLFAIQLRSGDTIHSSWKLNYPVYQFDVGDVTGDGIPEIAVGVIKPTRFYPKPDRRLFLFQISENLLIRPLWLGSRVAQPLQDFRIVKTQSAPIIRTLEREQDAKFLVAEYRWRGFGLEFVRYIKREILQQEAIEILYANTDE